MLQTIHIENFAIVEQLSLTLNHGLTIITGETGAGKSILIDALSLLSGDRADSSMVRQGCDAMRISAAFNISASVNDWLQAQDLNSAEEGECLVRRVINHNGRSRGYINDQPVSIKTLRELGGLLVDIHGQHAHQSLLNPDVQRQTVDDSSGDNLLRDAMCEAYQRWKMLHKQLNELGGVAQNRESHLALLRYQVQELSDFPLTDDAIKQLDEDHKRLSNASKLLENCQQALSLLDEDGKSSAVGKLSQATRLLSEAIVFDERLGSAVNMLDSALIQTQEAAAELQNYLHDLDIDPNHLQQIEAQMTALQDLARKHKVKYHALPAYFLNLSQQLTELESYEQRAAALDASVSKALEDWRKAAWRLHEQRVATAQQLAKKISQHMDRLAMPGGYLEIAVIADEMAKPSPLGMDKVEFRVCTNPGQPLRPLNKVVSGGELSRISLAIQVITAQTSGVPTLVFDEVDVGIGGGVAEIVGQLLRRLGEQRQVFCITHLPQVACQGHQHLQVSKSRDQNQTHARIELLDDNQRIEEIARMLGGVEITPQTLAHAQEMLHWQHH